MNDSANLVQKGRIVYMLVLFVVSLIVLGILAWKHNVEKEIKTTPIVPIPLTVGYKDAICSHNESSLPNGNTQKSVDEIQNFSLRIKQASQLLDYP